MPRSDQRLRYGRGVESIKALFSSQNLHDKAKWQPGTPEWKRKLCPYLPLPVETGHRKASEPEDAQSS